MRVKEMLFKGNKVFVEVDEEGHPIVEAGRAKMKYRPDDDRHYSPSIKNLTEICGSKMLDASAAPTKKRSQKRRSGSGADKEKATPPARGIEAGETIIAYTDGACIGNPGPAGLGYAITFPDGRRVQSGEPLGQATNNIAELAAIERALDHIDDFSTHVLIHTDSEYSIGVLVRGWKAKANKELIRSIKTKLVRFTNLELRKVKGHAGVPENELVDHLARTAAETQSIIQS